MTFERLVVTLVRGKLISFECILLAFIPVLSYIIHCKFIPLNAIFHLTSYNDFMWTLHFYSTIFVFEYLCVSKVFSFETMNGHSALLCGEKQVHSESHRFSLWRLKGNVLTGSLLRRTGRGLMLLTLLPAQCVFGCRPGQSC